jgi:hypothetical protein
MRLVGTTERTTPSMQPQARWWLLNSVAAAPAPETEKGKMGSIMAMRRGRKPDG